MKPPVNRCTWVLEQQNNNEEPLQYSGRERWNSMGIIKAAADAVRGLAPVLPISGWNIFEQEKWMIER